MYSFVLLQVGLENFMASDRWVQDFKVANNIVSRKITKFVSMDYNKKQETLVEVISDFVENMQLIIPDYDEDSVYNTDQSGFEYEMHGNRSLAPKGVKDVYGSVQSVNATTHTYTIQPVISLDGKIH